MQKQNKNKHGYLGFSISKPRLYCVIQASSGELQLDVAWNLSISEESTVYKSPAKIIGHPLPPGAPSPSIHPTQLWYMVVEHKLLQKYGANY